MSTGLPGPHQGLANLQFSTALAGWLPPTVDLHEIPVLLGTVYPESLRGNERRDAGIGSAGTD
jgi:hypothetical protein